MTERWEAERSALRAVSFGYAAAVDDGDGARFAALFTEDGELVVPNYPDDLRPLVVRTGTEQLRGIPGGLARYEWTFHQLAEPQLTFPDGDGRPTTATGSVRGVAHHVTADPSPSGPLGTDTVWYLRYADDYRRVEDDWRIARRVLHLQWVEERPVVAMAQRAGTGWGGGVPT